MPSARKLPAGMVSFVFTDIEGSTRLLRELGDGYDELLDLHNELLRSAWREHGGQEVGTEGDAFFVAFADPADAIRGAVAGQRTLAATSWPGGRVVRVRMGVHTGYARPRGDDYRALAANQAARIVAAAHGGQILVSADTATRAGPSIDGAELESLGRFRVRDFDNPIALYRAVAPGMPEFTASPRVRPADGHNLVRPTTSLVGREADLGALSAVVRPGAAVTLHGSAGVGKTRLAVEAALELAPRWPDGAWFVDLAPVRSPEVVPATIAEAVGAGAQPGAEAWREVLDHLREREALVILDNCEHLAEAVAARVAELLECCPRVGVLATSRASLGLRAERVQRVEPLETGVAGGPAVELFLDRAGGAAGHDPRAVASLCRELDGLPLAIELAAARAAVLDPSEIRQRLAASESLLRSRDPTLPERQRSLERLLEWSYELLDAETRTVLRRLTVFAASFDLDAAEAACAEGEGEEAGVAERLWTLLDLSLLIREAAAGSTRFRLLATVRTFAARRATDDEIAAARGRLATAYLARVGPGRVTDVAWSGEMAVELDNLRELAGRLGRAGPDAAIAQTLATSIGLFHDATDAFRGGIEEVSRWAAELTAPTPERAALLALLAFLHLRVAELDAAERVLGEASRLAGSAGVPPWDDAGLSRTRGELALRRGEPAVAAAVAAEALSVRHSPRGEARLFNLLGIARAAIGDLDGAAEAFARELSAASESGMEGLLAASHGNLAEVQLQRGDERAAARHQGVCLELAREQDQTVLIAFSMMIAARLAAEHGRVARGVRLQAAADAVLASAAYALYPEDAATRAELLELARARLGEPAYTAARGEGGALDVVAAADLAASVLAEVESTANAVRRGEP